MCQQKEKIKISKLLREFAQGSCVLNWKGLERCTASSIYSTGYLQGRVKNLPGLGLLLLIKHQLDQSYFHYNCEPSPLLSRIHFQVISLAETPHCTRIRLVLRLGITDPDLEAHDLTGPELTDP